MKAKETNAIDYLEGFQVGKQVGIREVVKWLDSHSILMAQGDSPDVRRGVNADEWDEKLKDWGDRLKQDELLEQIKTARNLFMVAYIIRKSYPDDNWNMLHTLLECGFESAQDLLGECIADED